MTHQGQIEAGFAEVASDVNELRKFIFPLGGRFLLDPNEFNAWGQLGPYDDTNSLDLGDVGDTTPSRLAGGVMFPWDVKLIQMQAFHQNSNALAEAWGWRIFRQAKAATPTAGSSVVTAVDILNEVNGATVGPRDYGNNVTQKTELTFTDVTIPAGEVLVLGVESPTAVATNYYVNIFSGFLEFERVLP